MDELIKLIKNISIYTLGNIINRALGFILIPLYSVYLSTEDYGIISAMTIFISICTIIIFLSLDRAVYRCYFDYKSEEERKTFQISETKAIKRMIREMINKNPLFTHFVVQKSTISRFSPPWRKSSVRLPSERHSRSLLFPFTSL